jgi:hypothetical protein
MEDSVQTPVIATYALFAMRGCHVVKLSSVDYSICLALSHSSASIKSQL